MRARDKRTATENFRCWCFTALEKKIRKTLGGWQLPPRPLFRLVRPRVNPYSKGLPSIVLVDICDFQVRGVYLNGFRN